MVVLWRKNRARDRTIDLQWNAKTLSLSSEEV